MFDWDNLRIFLTAVRAGNYTAASKLLRIDRTTVGRRLDKLEYQLGLPLFEQQGDSYQPTRAGSRALEAAAEIENLVDMLSTELMGMKQHRSGHIRLAVSAELGGEFFSDIAGFRHEHPEIELSIMSFADPSESVLQRRSDIALYLGSKCPSHLRGMKIGQLTEAPYAAQSYLDQQVHQGHALENLDWIIYAESISMPASQRWPAYINQSNASALRVDGWPALKEAALNGIGAARMWTFVADSYAELMRLGDQKDLQNLGLWLLVRDDVPIDPVVRLLMDHLAQGIETRTSSLEA